MINRPSYIEELKKWINKPQIKVITGIRRAGKSTILQLVKRELQNSGVSAEQIKYLNFESYITEPYKTAPALYQYLSSVAVDKKKIYLLLDEIQEVKEWEKAISSLLVDCDADIYLTGSNSHLLSSELSTFLAGRYVEIPVFTLSFQEFLAFKEQYHTGVSKYTSPFMEYLRRGGFPVIHHYNYDEDSAYKVVQDIYASVILRDTIQRYKIRDVDLLDRLVRFVFDNIGNTFSGKSVADFFKSQNRKTDVNTVYNYLHALEGAFVVYRVSRYDIKGKQLLKTQEKYFVSDISFVYAMMGFRDRMISGVLENLVYLELRRRGYQLFIGKVDTREIDFIAEKMGRKVYIQVAYRLESEATVEREFGPLLDIKDHYPKYVVTMDDVWKDSISGIQHLHIQDFLLSNFI